MNKQTLIIKLTPDPFDLDILPAAANRTVIPIVYEPEVCTLPYLNAMTLQLLEHVAKSLSVMDSVYIVMKPTAHSISMALMLWVAFSQVSIEPNIWILQREGIYVGTQEFVAAGVDWANRVKEGWRQKAAAELVADGEITREQDGRAE